MTTATIPDIQNPLISTVVWFSEENIIKLFFNYIPLTRDRWCAQDWAGGTFSSNTLKCEHIIKTSVKKRQMCKCDKRVKSIRWAPTLWYPARENETEGENKNKKEMNDASMKFFKSNFRRGTNGLRTPRLPTQPVWRRHNLQETGCNSVGGCMKGNSFYVSLSPQNTRQRRRRQRESWYGGRGRNDGYALGVWCTSFFMCARSWHNKHVTRPVCCNYKCYM